MKISLLNQITSGSAHIGMYRALGIACAGLALSGSACTGQVNADGASGDGIALPRPDGPVDTPQPGSSYELGETVPIVLHPVHLDADGGTELVGFGMPFPRGMLADAEQIAFFDAEGAELPAAVRTILPWRTLGEARDSDGSVRAAQVFVSVAFPDDRPLSIVAELGTRRTQQLELAADAEPSDSWVAVRDDDYAIELAEPAVYATLPPAWLGACELRTVTTPAYEDGDWKWFDEFSVGAAHTATNDVPDSVSSDELIELEDNEPWLFDRTATLFGVYARTGDITWLRRAHRSARFYLANFTDDGYFAYKDGDLKYVYGLSLLVDLMLTGDAALERTIARVAETHLEWRPGYDIDVNFWTERHQTYALLGALSAWELTGDEAHAERVAEIVEASFAAASSPPSGWPTDGCMLHTMRAHEGDDSDQPVCSPWMNALFADAMWRYYWHSRDGEALVFLADLADFIVEHGLYDGSDEGVDFLVPWYLVSSVYQYSDAGAWGDLEHTCDVANVVARGAWARKQLGEDYSLLADTAVELVSGCQYVLDYWHRPDGVSDGRPEWRLSPARKFNWWFGTTSDMPWIFGELGIAPR
ncbi:hypothetical protein [Haliangium ochraceum]|uniref:Uncharacterized protein n=1 Tax=Haliangium ochraceum (strain DSM 14365 / JCM 11303 / SMP-2) TaxID=502025 RepID=D0LK62_HALO1|nr:hypothetical protein [Haliangium ochraceum]ACY13096.1 hypothetical protein Hoch_0455 [Haliangium ochraceum DSM 14365]